MCSGRIVTLLRFLAARLFGLAILDCTDDCNSLESRQSAPCGLVCWKRFINMLGFVLEDSKECIGQELIIQGVVCNVASVEMSVSTSPARSQVLRNEIESILSSRSFPPRTARSLAPKLGFSCSGLFGRYGRAMNKPLHMRSKFLRQSPSDLSPALTISLQWWLHELAAPAVPRQVPLRMRQVFSFSDGEGKGCVAVGLWSDSGIFSSRCLAPSAVPPLWSSTDSFVPPCDHINTIEALGPILLLGTFPDVHRNCLWVHYIDNTTALSCIVNGSGSGELTGHAMSSICAHFWRLAASHHVFPWFEYVPSDLNIIDGFSRGRAFDRDPFDRAVQYRAPRLPDGWPDAKEFC